MEHSSFQMNGMKHVLLLVYLRIRSVRSDIPFFGFRNPNTIFYTKTS